MSTRPADTYDFRPTDRVSEKGPGQDSTNPLHDQYVADMFSGRGAYDYHGGATTDNPPRPGTERTSERKDDERNPNYDYHGGSDRVEPPKPERTSDKTFFEVLRNERGEVDRINFADGVSLRRTGPKEWELYRQEQKLSGAELAAFAKDNALQIPLCAKDGKILGNIKQKQGEDLYYDCRNTPLNIFATRKVDGSRDIRDYNDYSRTRIGTDSAKAPVVDFWDGYQWRTGTKQPLQGGGVQITFNPSERPPAGSSKPWPRAIVRDASADSLTVQHNDRLVMQAMWREQRLVTRTGEGTAVQEDTRFYDGDRWRHGRTGPVVGRVSESSTDTTPVQNLRRIDFTDGSGPQSVIIDITTGEIKERIGRMDDSAPRGNPRPRTDCGPEGCTPTDRRPAPQYRSAPRPYYVAPSYSSPSYCSPRG